MARLQSPWATLLTLDDGTPHGPATTRIDPRAQVLATGVFVVTVLSFGRYDVAALLPLALFPAVQAVQARVPWQLLLRTVLMAAPFALLVGAFNPWLDRAPMVAWGSITLSAGWVSWTAIAVRLVLTVCATVVLVAGTGLLPLCAALVRLGLPPVLALQGLLMLRYLTVLVDEAQRMDTARRLRAPAGRALPLAVWATLLGHLLLRALDRAQRVHLAMLARGFNAQRAFAAPVGLAASGTALGWRLVDTGWLVAWCTYFVAVRQFNAPQALGRWLAGVLA